jgi:hypothetical protein
MTSIQEEHQKILDPVGYCGRPMPGSRPSCKDTTTDAVPTVCTDSVPTATTWVPGISAGTRRQCDDSVPTPATKTSDDPRRKKPLPEAGVSLRSAKVSSKCVAGVAVSCEEMLGVRGLATQKPRGILGGAGYVDQNGASHDGSLSGFGLAAICPALRTERALLRPFPAGRLDAAISASHQMARSCKVSTCHASLACPAGSSRLVPAGKRALASHPCGRPRPPQVCWFGLVAEDSLDSNPSACQHSAAPSGCRTTLAAVDFGKARGLPLAVLLV